MDRIGSVITGDIINSSKFDLQTRNDIREILATISKIITTDKIFGEFIPSQIDIFRGDGWQLLITAPKYSLRIALLIRSLLRSSFTNNKIDTRESIGIGSIHPSKERVSLGDGEAFILSGKGLDSRENKCNLTLKVSSELIKIQPYIESLNAIFSLLNFISENWTSKQAYAISGHLRFLKSEQIADNWFNKIIKRQVVSSHLAKGGKDSIEDSLLFYENLFDSLSY